jgi:signal peptidase I
MSNTPQKQSFREYLWDLVKIIIISLAIILPIRYFIIQPFVVKGNSMEPSFSDGDYLIINEINYRFKNPSRGDVVVFRYPKDLSQYYIKRIIGLPGEKVEVKNGKVKIYNSKNPQGIELKESYLIAGLTPGNLEVTLANGEYFVLGDNRFASSDSRIWGVLPKEDIIGKAWLRGWPVARAQVFSGFEYQIP